jgi:hypothetical protein
MCTDVLEQWQKAAKGYQSEAQHFKAQAEDLTYLVFCIRNTLNKRAYLTEKQIKKVIKSIDVELGAHRLSTEMWIRASDRDLVEKPISKER